MSRWGTGIGVAARVQALVAAVGVPCGAEAAVGRTRLCSGPVVSFMLRPCLPESRCPSLGTIWLAGALLGKRRQGRMPKTPPLRCALGVRLVELTASRARYHPGQPSGTAEGDASNVEALSTLGAASSARRCSGGPHDRSITGEGTSVDRQPGRPPGSPGCGLSILRSSQLHPGLPGSTVKPARPRPQPRCPLPAMSEGGQREVLRCGCPSCSLVLSPQFGRELQATGAAGAGR